MPLRCRGAAPLRHDPVGAGTSARFRRVRSNRPIVSHRGTVRKALLAGSRRWARYEISPPAARHRSPHPARAIRPTSRPRPQPEDPPRSIRGAATKSHLCPPELRGMSRLRRAPRSRPHIPQSPLGILLQTPRQKPTNARRRSGGQRTPIRLTFKNLRERRGNIVASERVAPGEHLVQDTPERPHVGAFVNVLSARLLGAHIRRRSQDDARFGVTRERG